MLPDEPICDEGLFPGVAVDRDSLEEDEAAAKGGLVLEALELGAKSGEREVLLLGILQRQRQWAS